MARWPLRAQLIGDRGEFAVVGALRARRELQRVVLVDDLRGNLALQDLAEDAVLVRHERASLDDRFRRAVMFETPAARRVTRLPAASAQARSPRPESGPLRHSWPPRDAPADHRA